MSEQQPEDDRLVRYLLGDPSPDAEQEVIEQRYFTDDLYFDHLMAIEDDLIDSHIRGTLSEGEKSRFEKHFLASNRRREKWQAQRAIASFFRSRSRRAGLVAASASFVQSLSLGARIVTGASALAVVAGAMLLGWGYTSARQNQRQLESQVAALRDQSANAPLVATFALRAERLRSAGGDQFQIPSGTRWVVLHLELPGSASGFSTFAAELTTADGQAIWEQKGLPRAGLSTEVNLPALILKPGDYVLSLRALDGTNETSLPSYQFRVDR